MRITWLLIAWLVVVVQPALSHNNGLVHRTLTSGVICTPINNSVATQTKWTYKGVKNNSNSNRWVVCPVPVEVARYTYSASYSRVGVSNDSSDGIEVLCYFRYEGQDGWVTLTYSLNVSANSMLWQATPWLGGSMAMPTWTCRLPPSTSVKFVEAKVDNS